MNEQKNLLDWVSAPGNNFHEIEKYLESLIETPELIADEMNKTEVNTGRTVLHIAAANGNTDLIKLLLDFDAPAATLDDNQQSCQELAHLGEKSASTEEIKVEFKKISALLRTRGSWQNEDDSFLLKQSIHVAEKAIKSIKNSEGKTAALFMGTTGHGKSTLINCLLGIDYESYIENGDHKIRQINPFISEPAKVGDSANSETLYPKLYDGHHHSSWITDMPGYEGTREAETICVAASTQMLTKQLGQINGVIFVCSYNDISDTRKPMFRKTAAKIGRMIMKNPNAKNNIVLAVTKKTIFDSDEEEQVIANVCKELIKLRDSLKPYPLSVDLETCQRGQAYIDNVAVKCVTDALLTSQKIIIADVTNSELTRKRFDNTFNQLKPLNPSEYNFSDFDGDMRRFISLMKKIIGFYDSLLLNMENLKSTKENLNVKIRECHILIDDKCQELNNIISELNQPFSPSDFDKKINRNYQDKEKLFDIIQKLEKLMESYHLKKHNLECEKQNIGKHQVKLLNKLTIIGQKTENEMQLFDQKLQVQSESLLPLVSQMLNKVNQELAITKGQYEAREVYRKKLKENKSQALTDHAYIQSNSGPMIEALKSEISVLKEKMSELMIMQIENNDNLEARQYEFVVNKHFFKNIKKLFDVLGTKNHILANEESCIDEQNQAMNTYSI